MAFALGAFSFVVSPAIPYARAGGDPVLARWVRAASCLAALSALGCGTVNEVVRIEAVRAPELSAQMGECRELRYAAGPSAEADRPAFVRAASGLAWMGGELAVVQDDASFVGLVADDGTVRAAPLPRGEGGRRVFEERLGNKQHKLDLEASVAVDGRLFAFGSGSLPARERIAIVERDARARIVDASRFYTMLRETHAFSGSELNVEGAVVLGDTLRLFQRGNGAPRDGLSPVNATADVSLAALLAWLDAGARAEPPALARIVQYDLGSVAGVPYTFTDAAAFDAARILFLAGAEDSPDTYRDGAILGARIGVIDDSGARYTDLIDPHGHRAAVKAEGILPDPHDRTRVHIVLDPDDPDRPAQLCTARLSGPWR